MQGTEERFLSAVASMPLISWPIIPATVRSRSGKIADRFFSLDRGINSIYIAGLLFFRGFTEENTFSKWSFGLSKSKQVEVRSANVPDKEWAHVFLFRSPG